MKNLGKDLSNNRLRKGSCQVKKVEKGPRFEIFHENGNSSFWIVVLDIVDHNKRHVLASKLLPPGVSPVANEIA